MRYDRRSAFVGGVGYETYRVFLDRLLQRLRQEFGEQAILAVALFGSMARGQARPDSDTGVMR